MEGGVAEMEKEGRNTTTMSVRCRATGHHHASNRGSKLAVHQKPIGTTTTGARYATLTLLLQTHTLHFKGKQKKPRRLLTPPRQEQEVSSHAAPRVWTLGPQAHAKTCRVDIVMTLAICTRGQDTRKRWSRSPFGQKHLHSIRQNRSKIVLLDTT